MPDPSIKALQLTAGNAAGVAAAQAVAGAGNLTLTANPVVLGTIGTTLPARRVIITSTSNSDSGVIFTLTGTNRAGLPQSETITGVTTVAVQSQLDYQTVTQIAANGATVGNISAGTNGVASSDWIALDMMAVMFDVGIFANGPAGTTYTIEVTPDDFMKQGFGSSGVLAPSQFTLEADSNVPATVFPLTGFQAVSGQQMLDWGTPSFGVRLTVNSGTGLVTMWALQSGIAAR